MTVAAITPELRAAFELSAESEGVVIVEVDDNGPAAAQGLRPGDIVLEVNQDVVGSPPELAAAVSEVQAANGRSVLLFIESRGDPKFVVLNIAS
jgi:serine protease Do